MPPSDTERAEIRAVRDHHIGRLFLQAHRAYSAHAMDMLRQRGYTELGAAHAAILPHIDVDGTRATVIAERSGMTKQGAGQVVDDLARQGLVNRIPDPTDGRASLVVFTDAGWDYLRAASALKQEIEAEYAELLGPEAFRALCENIGRIVAWEKHRVHPRIGRNQRPFPWTASGAGPHDRSAPDSGPEAQASGRQSSSTSCWRIFFRPNRIRPLTVPSGTPMRSAIS